MLHDLTLAIIWLVLIYSLVGAILVIVDRQFYGVIRNNQLYWNAPDNVRRQRRRHFKLGVMWPYTLKHMRKDNDFR